MQQLIYASQETTPFAPRDLKRLLTRSQIRNRASNLTGLLIYSEGWFLQALEGDSGPLRETFDRIEIDGRHSNVRVLLTRDVSERAFGRWAMGYPDPSDTSQVLRDYVKIGTDWNLSSLDGEQAFQLLVSCARMSFAEGRSRIE